MENLEKYKAMEEQYTVYCTLFILAQKGLEYSFKHNRQLTMDTLQCTIFQNHISMNHLHELYSSFFAPLKNIDTLQK